MDDAKYQHKNGVAYRYTSDWINQLESEEHWLLYRKQQAIMFDYTYKGDHALEIGPGTGFTSNYLKAKGVNVTTLDIDEYKQPDIQANIVEFVPEEKFDQILAFEVLEHIPYDKSLKVLYNLRNFSEYIFISVPVNEIRLFKLFLDLPVIKKLSLQIFIPRMKIEVKNHFWEIKYSKYTEKRFVEDIQNIGYQIIKREKYLSRLFLVLKQSNTQSNS